MPHAQTSTSCNSWKLFWKRQFIKPHASKTLARETKRNKAYKAQLLQAQSAQFKLLLNELVGDPLIYTFSFTLYVT